MQVIHMHFSPAADEAVEELRRTIRTGTKLTVVDDPDAWAAYLAVPTTTPTTPTPASLTPTPATSNTITVVLTRAAAHESFGFGVTTEGTSPGDGSCTSAACLLLQVSCTQ